MKVENIKKIAIAKKVEDKELFITFLNLRFPNELDCITSYFEEWADRFNTGHPETFMDKVTKAIYMNLKHGTILRDLTNRTVENTLRVVKS